MIDSLWVHEVICWPFEMAHNTKRSSKLVKNQTFVILIAWLGIFRSRYAGWQISISKNKLFGTPPGLSSLISTTTFCSGTPRKRKEIAISNSGSTEDWLIVCLRWFDCLKQDHTLLRHCGEKQDLAINFWFFNTFSLTTYSNFDEFVCQQWRQHDNSVISRGMELKNNHFKFHSLSWLPTNSLEIILFLTWLRQIDLSLPSEQRKTSLKRKLRKTFRNYLNTSKNHWSISKALNDKHKSSMIRRLTHVIGYLSTLVISGGTIVKWAEPSGNRSKD